MATLLRTLSLLGAVVAITAAAACSSSSTGTTPAADTGNADSGVAVTCQNDPRVATYVANLVEKSASGSMSVTLVSSDPAPPIRGTNDWVVKIADASGNPMANATLTVTPFMPDHGHGTSVTPTVTTNPDGSYAVANVYLFMPGVWRVTIANTAAAADSVDFFFCIPG
jgi:YtkA-like